MVYIKQDFTPSKGSQVPFNGLIEKAIQGYYRPKMMQADIFHKTVAPLTNLAVSPVFMLLSPQQREMISQYIGQNVQSFLGPQFGQNQANQGQSGSPQGAGEEGSPNINDVGNAYTQQTAKHYSGEQLTPGQTYQTSEGTVLNAPPDIRGQAARGQVGLPQTLESIQRLEDEEKKIANQSWLAHPLNKLGFALGNVNPFFRQLKPAEIKAAEASAQGNLRNYHNYTPEAAEAEIQKGTSRPIEQHIKSLEGLKKRISETTENLKRASSKGVNLDKSIQKGVQNKVMKNRQEREDAEHTAKLFNTTPEIVLEAQSLGIKDAKAFRRFISERNRNG